MADSSVDMFSPITLRGVTLRNRIGMAPMCSYLAENGLVNDSHVAHYGAHAMGGCGLILVECTAVSASGRLSPNDLGIWSDEHIAGLRRLADLIKKHGCVAGIQIGHSGGKGMRYPPDPKSGRRNELVESAERPLAPSSVPMSVWGRAEQGEMSKEATLADIAQVVADFRAAARRAKEAGFQVLEIHTAHGYLSHEFLSPLTNHRSDDYGGSFTNRTRLLREVVAAVRDEWDRARPLFVRLSCADYVEGGWTEQDSIELSRLLVPLTVDLIDCSSGGIVAQAKYNPFTGYQVPFADHIRAQASVATAAVGMIINPQDADAVIRKGQADLVLIGRQMLRDPYWAVHAARTLNRPDAEHWPETFVWCIGPSK